MKNSIVDRQLYVLPFFFYLSIFIQSSFVTLCEFLRTKLFIPQNFLSLVSRIYARYKKTIRIIRVHCHQSTTKLQFTVKAQ